MMRVARVLALFALLLTAIAIPAVAAVRTGRYGGRGVSFVVTSRSIERFKISVVYVCGPQGKQRVPLTMKLSGIALTARGTFRFKMEQGPLILSVTGSVTGGRASGTADGFGDVGAGSSDCGTGTVRWSAKPPAHPTSSERPGRRRVDAAGRLRSAGVDAREPATRDRGLQRNCPRGLSVTR
jgi:hypothetical protein